MEEGRSEIVFFDVETTIPNRKGQKFALLEFGAILVCSRKLVELQSFCTLIRPDDISAISETTTKCNGITRKAVEDAPKFQDVADRVYDLLHGRVWAGHNIICFDCVRIREAFAEIGRQGPEAKGIIDSLRLLQTKFGHRAGNLKMATLADYFGLGSQKHRSLDDVRMNLEVIKYCATVLFLEENYRDVLIAEKASPVVESETSAASGSRSCGQGKTSSETLSDEKSGKPMKNKLPFNTGAKNFANVSNKETKELLKASVQKSKEKSNTRDKEMKGVSNESVKVINSEVNNGTLNITKMFDRLQSYWSQSQALQDGNVGVLSDPSNSIAGSVTEQSEIKESECFLEPHKKENYTDVLIAEMASTAVESEISSVSAGISCGQGKSSSDKKLRKPMKKKLPVNNVVKNFSSVSNKEIKEVLKASVQERKEISNTSGKEMEGVSNESVEVINSEVNKGTFDITTMCESLPSVWSQPQALQDGHIGVLSDSSNPIPVSMTESSEIRESECFLEPHEVCSSVLRTAFVPTKWGTEKMILTYKDQPLQMNSRKMMIRFGISKKYFVPTGKPKLSFVVEPSLETCEILKVCDNLAQKLYSECNGNSEWRPLITTKKGLVNAMPAIRMHIASVGAGESATYCTELYQKNSTGTAEKLAYTSVDIDELNDLFLSGRFVDADFSFDIYDYLRSAGIRLVARRLTVDCRGR